MPDEGGDIVRDGTAPAAEPAGSLWLTWFGAALPMIILPVVILSIPVSTAATAGLTQDELTSWLVGLYITPCALSLVLALWYRQPLLLTGNVFYIIFISRISPEFGFPDIVGASIIAGAIILTVGATGVSERLASLVPPPIVLGVLAGAVLPFVVDLFTLLGEEPVAVGGMTLAFLAGQRFLGGRIPPILPALGATAVLAPLTGNAGSLPNNIPLVSATMVAPTFGIDAVLTVVPVLVMLILLQSNLPSIVYLRSQGYAPPERTIGTISGLGTAIASLVGPTGISLSLPATSFVAGPIAGPRQTRYMVVAIASGVLLALLAFVGVAAELPEMISLDLLFALAGLAVIGVLTHAMKAIVAGPLTLGPLFAFAIALSDLSVLGMNAFFWALVIGTAVSHTVERDGLAH